MEPRGRDNGLNMKKSHQLEVNRGVDTEWVKILKPEKVWNKYSVIDLAGPIVLRHD